MGRTGTVIIYGYPVFVGGYADNTYAAAPAPQPQPDITVNDSSQPASAVMQYFGSEDARDPTTPTAAADDIQPVGEPASTTEPSHYLIAFKDHSIYSAVAYWVDGDTLHYFTSGNTHNQASVSLVDRDLTERLNKESGLEVRLP
jgi:endonuclease YncB( thermonuclease family)